MDEKHQQAIRYWTLAQRVVSADVASVVRDFRDRDGVLQSIAVLESFQSNNPFRSFTGWAIFAPMHSVEMRLLYERELPPDFFEHTSHHTADRRVEIENQDYEYCDPSLATFTDHIVVRFHRVGAI